MNLQYLIRKTEHDEVQPCDSCGCEVATRPFDWGPPFGEKHDTEKRYLCEFCSFSYVSNITRYSSLLRDEVGYLRKEIAVLIAQAVNHVLSKLPSNGK